MGSLAMKNCRQNSELDGYRSNKIVAFPLSIVKLCALPIVTLLPITLCITPIVLRNSSHYNHYYNGAPDLQTPKIMSAILLNDGQKYVYTRFTT